MPVDRSGEGHGAAHRTARVQRVRGDSEGAPADEDAAHGDRFVALGAVGEERPAGSHGAADANAPGRDAVHSAGEIVNLDEVGAAQREDCDGLVTHGG